MPNGGQRLACALASTYHFYCPVEHRVDVLCYMWLEHGEPHAVDQAARS